jgi:DNA polymerase-4
LVKSNRITKSVAAEHTFDVNLSSEVFMMEQLEIIAIALEKRLKKHNVAGKQLL